MENGRYELLTQNTLFFGCGESLDQIGFKLVKTHGGEKDWTLKGRFIF